MKTSELLTAARAIITPPESWTQGWFAKDAAGEDVPSSSRGAVCFCSMGALNKADGNRGGIPYATRFLAKFIDEETSIPEFNDNHTHEEVLQMFDRAIALAKEQGE